MIIADKEQPKNSFFIDNSISDKGTIIMSFVLTDNDKIIKLGLTQIKLLRDHLDHMLKEYEDKANRNPSV